MITRNFVVLVAACLVATHLGAHAENPMGYRLLSPDEVAQLPHNHGALGLDVERAQQITDDGMTFDIMRVKQVRHGSAGMQAGLKTGDNIIAVDGRVFPTIASFAAYVGSMMPGSRIAIDYMPAGSGPQQAQRVMATTGGGERSEQASTGMSTGTKIAIGAGAVALLGCYEMGCFSHHGGSTAPNGGQPQNR